MTTDTDGLYKTTDLYYAAYLKTAGAQLVDTETRDYRTTFVFDRPENLRGLKNQYFNRTARVCALSYADEIKALKNLTHMED